MCLVSLFPYSLCFALNNSPQSNQSIRMFYQAIWWLIKINRKYNRTNCSTSFWCVLFFVLFLSFSHNMSIFMICLLSLHVSLRKLNGFVICQLRLIVIQNRAQFKIIDDFQIAICLTHKNECVVVYLWSNKHLTSLKMWPSTITFKSFIPSLWMNVILVKKAVDSIQLFWIEWRNAFVVFICRSYFRLTICPVKRQKKSLNRFRVNIT